MKNIVDKKLNKNKEILIENTDQIHNGKVIKNKKKLTETQKIITSSIAAMLMSIGSSLAIYYVNMWSLALNIIVMCSVIALGIIYIVLRCFKKTVSIGKLLFTIIILIFSMACLFSLLKVCGVIEYFSSAEKIRNLILSTGLWGIIIFIVLQICQVIVSPVPGMVTIAVGAQVFGPLAGFAYSSIGIILGSIVAFLIGRFFSEKVALMFVSEDDLIKYRSKLNQKGRLLLPLLFLFPFFPDDVICIVAGLTTMKFGYFLIVTLITRPVSILISSYFMSGNIIPFSGYGLIVWGVLIVIVAVLFWLVTKYSEQIENFFLRKPNHNKKIKNATTQKLDAVSDVKQDEKIEAANSAEKLDAKIEAVSEAKPSKKIKEDSACCKTK